MLRKVTPVKNLTDLHLQKIVVDTSCLVSNQRPYDRPRRSRAKVMFLQASVILLTGRGVSASVHAGIHPLGADTPQSRHPPLGADTPGADTPQE